MFQTLRSSLPLTEGYNACVHCRRPDLAITEISEYLEPAGDTYAHAGYRLDHWCGDDSLLEKEGLGILRRYCHGYVGSDMHLKASSQGMLAVGWNTRNPKHNPMSSWWRRPFGKGKQHPIS